MEVQWTEVAEAAHGYARQHYHARALTVQHIEAVAVVCAPEQLTGVIRDVKLLTTLGGRARGMAAAVGCQRLI